MVMGFEQVDIIIAELPPMIPHSRGMRTGRSPKIRFTSGSLSPNIPPPPHSHKASARRRRSMEQNLSCFDAYQKLSCPTRAICSIKVNQRARVAPHDRRDDRNVTSLLGAAADGSHLMR